MNRYKRRVAKLARVSWKRWVRVVLWWRRYDRRYALWWRAANLLAAVFIIVTAVLPIAEQVIQNERYKLSAAAIELAGHTDPSLSKQLVYDAKTRAYQFNQSSIEKDDLPSKLQHASVGAENKSNTKSYALEVPEDITKGVTYHDTDSQLSFSLVPEFKGMAGKTVDGHLVFPLGGNNQAVYTLKNNGLKEDIIVPKVTENTMRFDYQLKLPKTLEAKIIEGSGGAIGIYSADPLLFNNMSYGSDADRAAMEKVRQKSPKTNLVFGLPAPIIKAPNGASVGHASARFALNGSRLSVIAEDLSGVTTPITIDPSVTVTSTTDFETGGNNESNIDFDTSGQITRGKLTGGGVGTWAAATTLTNQMEKALSLAYNGYMYVIGGTKRTPLASYTDVQYAQINSDGTLGAWTATTSLPTYRNDATPVVYNGYIYVIGGVASGGAIDTALYVAVNPDGTLGTWGTTTSIPVVVKAYGATAYNGYLYILGGSVTGSGATFMSTVYYVAINPNGTLGTWGTTTALSYARSTLTANAYNGYMYIFGGANATPSFVADVQYAKINDDGTLGAWATTSNFTGARYGHTTVVYNGYVYLMGGWTGGTNYKNDVQYAQINANGTLGTWRTTSSFTTGRCYVIGAAYNGYLYVGTGYDGTNNYNDMQYVKIDPAGDIGAYTVSGNTFTTTRRGAQTVAYNGFLYVMGGYNGTNAPVNTIYASAIGTDGTLGAFTATGMTAFTTARSYFGAVAYNGYMYVFGGCTSAYASCTTAGNDIATVYMSAIAADGTLGAWSAQTAFTTGRYGLSAVVYNGYVYVMGGINGSTFQNDIQYHAIGAAGAISGAWTTSAKTINTAARAYFGAAVYGGNLYISGGCSAGALTCTTTRNDVQYAQLATSGDLSANLTNNGTSFTTTRGGHGMVMSNGYVYIMGGMNNGTYYADTQYAPINTDGSVGTWASSGDALSTTRDGIGVVAYNGFIYVAGGYNGTTYYNDVQYTGINNGGSGAIGAWTTSSNLLPNNRFAFATQVYNGYIYLMGGYDQSTTYYNTVYLSKINADGTNGAWTPAGVGGAASTFTNARDYLASAQYNGYLYILGGYSGAGGSTYKDVQYAKINADGTLGSWASDGTFDTATETTALRGLSAVAMNGYMYVMGGYDGTTRKNTVRLAPINADGTLGTWVSAGAGGAASTFTGLRYLHDAVAYNGYIYIVGGYTGAAYYNDVQYAKPNSDGTIPTSGAGSWTYTTSFNIPRYSHSVSVSNGFMYIMGGYSGAENTDVQVVPINANGTLGNWMSTTDFTTGRDGQGGVVHDGFAFVFGGSIGASTTNNVQYAKVAAISRSGRYSKLINLGSAVNISGITYTGTVPTGALGITYKAGGANGTSYVSSGMASNVSGAGGCAGTTNYTQYLLVTVVLDDSQFGSAVFPDADANNTPGKLTDFTVAYNPVHPAPNIRLRGGKTLQTSFLSPLDTCSP